MCYIVWKLNNINKIIWNHIFDVSDYLDSVLILCIKDDFVDKFKCTISCYDSVNET